MRRVVKLLLCSTAAVLLTFGSPAAANVLATGSATCTKAANVEAIVDDSISMEFTDGDRLRVQAMNLLIDTLPPATNLGAVEFGSGGFEDNPPPASTVFPPQPVGPNAATMRTALDQAIHADNGATDYNGAFARADADNPNADARIFLTDGGHIVGTYNEAHLVHNVRTYVIGFGGVAAGEDQARLKKIAADGGGRYFPIEDSAQLQAVMNTIGAALTCQTPPRQFTDLLKQGQSKTHSVAIGAATKAIQITLTWTSALDKFKVFGLKLSNKGQLLAIAARPNKRKPAKLKVSRKTSSTFTVLKVSNLRKGRLSFRVRAAKIGSGAPKVSLTTQVSQSAQK